MVTTTEKIQATGRKGAPLGAPGTDSIAQGCHGLGENASAFKSAIVSEIARLHGEILTAAKTSLLSAIRIGELLAEQKAMLKHGEWLPWLKANVPFAERSARNYMRCYVERDRLKSASVADLGEAYRLLAPPPEPDQAKAASSLLRQWEADFVDLVSKYSALPALTVDLTLPQVANAWRESRSLWDTANRLALDAEYNLGKALVEAKEMGIDEDQVLAEVNRLLKESAPDPAATFSAKAAP